MRTQTGTLTANSEHRLVHQMGQHPLQLAKLVVQLKIIRTSLIHLKFVYEMLVHMLKIMTNKNVL